MKKQETKMFVEISDQKSKYTINTASIAFVENATAGRYTQTRIVFVGGHQHSIVVALSYEEVVRQLSLLTTS